MPLIILLEKITSALDAEEFTVALFIDFRKAFDTIDHQILLAKLFHYGVRGIAYDWIQSYLTNRSQYASYNSSNSTSMKINCGVPQCSILGPLLFLIYINDLASVSNILTSLLFADDTTLTYSGKNLSDIIATFNLELNIIVHWLNANRLSLNLDKTYFMVFRPKGKKLRTPTHNCK